MTTSSPSGLAAAGAVASTGASSRTPTAAAAVPLPRLFARAIQCALKNNSIVTQSDFSQSSTRAQRHDAVVRIAYGCIDGVISEVATFRPRYFVQTRRKFAMVPGRTFSKLIDLGHLITAKLSSGRVRFRRSIAAQGIAGLTLAGVA